MTAESPDAWLPGDRLPDVVLLSVESTGVRLHAEYAGKPLWLAIPGSEGKPATRIHAPPTGVVALWLTDEESATGEVPHGWQSFKVRADWRRHLEGPGGAFWLTDSNLRLVECHPLEEAAISACLQRAAGPAMPTSTRAMAPILIIPDVFEQAFCARLVQHFEVDCAGGEASRVLVSEKGHARYELDPGVKQRRESPVRDQQIETRMHALLMRRALPEIQRVFQFSVVRRDPFKLLAYPAGAGYFRPHRDNETPDVAHRKFALSINLNQGAYDGGEFGYPEFGQQLYSPATGSALVFSCSLLHELTPVIVGERMAMTVFLA